MNKKDCIGFKILDRIEVYDLCETSDRIDLDHIIGLKSSDREARDLL